MKYNYYSTNKDFTEIEKNVLDYIDNYQDDMRKLTIQTLADETFTSKSTIFRLAKKLGFNGYTDMIYHLSSQQDSEDNIDVENYISNLSISMQKIFMQNEKLIEIFKQRIENKDQSLYIIGTGYSGIIGEYMYKKILGKGELVHYSNGGDSNALFLNNLHRISNIICISKSGETDLVNSKAEIAHDKGIGVISFTHSEDNTLAKLSDLPFVIYDNQYLDRNNINPTQFYSMLLVYLEYVIEKSF